MIGVRPLEPAHADGVGSIVLSIQQSEFDLQSTGEARPDLADGRDEHLAQCFVVVADVRRSCRCNNARIAVGNPQVAAASLMEALNAHRGSMHDVAGRVLETLVAWSKARHVREIYLGTTAKRLAAHRDCQKNGFREIARRDLPEGFPLMVIDSRFYCRTLRPRTRKVHA